MDLIIDEIVTYQRELNYVMKNKYADEVLNTICNHWIFLSDFADQLVSQLGIPIDRIVYSEYYWCTKFLREHTSRFSDDAGLEQQQFQLIEKIEHTLGEVDLSLLESIENNI